MSEAPKRPHKPTKPFVQIDPRWWSLGVVDGYKSRPLQGGVPDQFSYTSGRVEGIAAPEQGRSVDEVLAKYKIPYREADFQPMPPLVSDRHKPATRGSAFTGQHVIGIYRPVQDRHIPATA